MRDQIRSDGPAVSIIVPGYKPEAFLDQCAGSILSQTERDFELLLIDDGSPDGSGAMCDAYAARDPRVRVIHKPNGGVSSARNAGLDAAGGRCVVFIDSDDYVEPDYLEQLLRPLRQLEAPEQTLILNDYQPFSAKGHERREFPQAFSVRLDGPDADPQAFRDLIFGFRLFPPYCKLFWRDIIEDLGLRFDTAMRSAEDFDFNMRYLARMERICYLPSPSYHYRVDYKKYVPSNHGVLGASEIKSAHIMAHGIVELAKRMGVYEALEPEISLWAAKKHYFNRLPMLFAPSDAVSKAQRRQLYQQLIADPTYREAAKRGIRAMPAGTKQKIGSRADCFTAWYLFYKILHKRTKTGKEGRK